MTSLQQPRCAIVQIAVEECVYLIDSINLPQKDVQKFLQAVMGSRDITVLGMYYLSCSLAILELSTLVTTKM